MKFLTLLSVCILIITSCIGQQNFIKTIKGRKIPIRELNDFINNQIDSLKIPGISLAIINNGKIAYYKNYGVKNLDTKEKVTDNTIFEVCSVSKPVFAYFFLQQVKKGLMSLDQPLYTYFTDPKIDTTRGYYKMLTARMVLNHCSGFPNWRTDEDENNPLSFIAMPGTQYGYSGEGYQYLVRVLKNVLGKSDTELNGYFQKEIVRPLHAGSMNFTWTNSLQPLKAYSHKNGHPTDNGPQGPPDWFGAAGSLHCTAKDYAKFIISLMGNENEIAKVLLHLNTDLPKEPDSLYRSFGFPYKMAEGKQRFYHTGNNSDTRAYTHFYPKEKSGIVIFANCDNFFSSRFLHKLFLLLDEPMTY